MTAALMDCSEGRRKGEERALQIDDDEMELLCVCVCVCVHVFFKFELESPKYNCTLSSKENCDKKMGEKFVFKSTLTEKAKTLRNGDTGK